MAELQARIDATPPDDILTVESLLSHRDRVAQAPEWSTDTRGFSRAAFYLIVPPLAWVGAAIVEKGVDQFF